MDRGEAVGAVVVVGEAVGGVFEGVVERNELTAAAAHYGEEGGAAVGIEAVGMDQHYLGNVAADHFGGALLEERENGIHVGEVGFADADGERGVGLEGGGVDGGEHPIGIIER